MHDSSEDEDRSRAPTLDGGRVPYSDVVPRAEGAVAPGTSIGGRYLVIRPLGEGGMGTVWEVEHVGLGTRFALKLLRRTTQLSPLGIARFRREARTAATIAHPNVVQVVDFSEDSTLGPFLVMQLLEGECLVERVSPDAPMRLREVVEWLGPVAHALDVIHERGLVHRDVKPENILRGRDGTIKLVDFGLVAHVDGRDRLTRQGATLGTPQYMAPEVAEGASATPASDVYSLAVVAYELLTGRLPYDSESAQEVMEAKLKRPHPSLAEGSGRMFSVPLEIIFSEAFELDPTLRPAPATTFVQRLAKCIRR